MTKRKFKEGDLVECINGKSKGAGWKLNYKFIVIRISEGLDDYNNPNYVYWNGFDNNGVHQDGLRLASEYKLKINKKKGGDNK